jgi:hypothetical protein
VTRERRDRGKWSEHGVPQKGWRESDCLDLGENHWMTCEMCESIEIRIVHVVEHPGYGSLRVGRVCAGHLTEDYAGCDAREEEARARTARAARRAKWTSLKGWRPIKYGEQQQVRIRHLGWEVLVYEGQGAWWWRAMRGKGSSLEIHHSPESSPDPDTAAMLAFDAAWPATR